MRKLGILLLLVGSIATARSDEDQTALCVLCHGTNANGNSAVRAPKLAGLDREYLSRQLQSFRSGIRGTHAQDISGGEMRTIAVSLKDREIAAVLGFIANQKGERPIITIQGNATRGKATYAACAACHGTRGEGNPSLGAPALAQGSDWYWVIQLNNYRDGVRGTSPADVPGNTMRAAVATLPNDQAVVDVVAYINTLP